MDLVIISLCFGWFPGALTFLSPLGFAVLAGFGAFAF